MKVTKGKAGERREESGDEARRSVEKCEGWKPPPWFSSFPSAFSACPVVFSSLPPAALSSFASLSDLLSCAAFVYSVRVAHVPR